MVAKATKVKKWFSLTSRLPQNAEIAYSRESPEVVTIHIRTSGKLDHIRAIVFGEAQLHKILEAQKSIEQE